MKKCIYCREHKEDGAFTLEHIIPQFMGGAYAPDYFKVHDVCNSCNSNLGLFVDAGFEKNWFVSNKLRMAAYSSFNPDSKVGLPLICMGRSNLTPPQLKDEEICELWLGPLGESVFWIRPHDERLYWYTGGNPVTTKRTESRAYFFFSERSAKNPRITWFSFRDAFEGRRVRKVMCTEIQGANPTEIGFKEPDELDQLRIEYFSKACRETPIRQNQLTIYTQFDFRFMAKIGIGVAYALFGAKALDSAYSEELYKALWFREGNEPPLVNGTSHLTSGANPNFLHLTGEKNAVTITVIPTPDGVALNINIDATLNWTVKCASLENIEEEVQGLGHGRVIVLYRQLQRSVDLSVTEYIAHKCGNILNPQLCEISDMAKSQENYLREL